MYKEKMADSRLAWVDYAKGIGIILVVYGHVVGGADVSNMKIPAAFLFFREIIYHFHMPLFFFLSGIFVQHSLLSRGIKKFILDKLCFIAYPYFVWSILQGMILILISNYTYLNFSISDLLVVWYKPLQHFWFLYSLMLMYVTQAALTVIGRFALSLTVLASIFLYFYPIMSPIVGVDHFSINLIFFAIGMNYKESSLDEMINRNLSFLIVILVIGLFVSCEVFTRFIESAKIFSLPATIVGIIMVSLISKYFAKTDFFPSIKTVGFYSMPIYLAHGIGGSGARVILYNILGLKNYNIIIFISCVMGVAIPLILYKLMMRFNFPYLFELKNG